MTALDDRQAPADYNPFDRAEDTCGKCGIDHPPRVACAEADAYMSGVTYWNPEGSTIDPRTGVLWGEEAAP